MRKALPKIFAPFALIAGLLLCVYLLSGCDMFANSITYEVDEETGIATVEAKEVSGAAAVGTYEVKEGVNKLVAQCNMEGEGRITITLVDQETFKLVYDEDFREQNVIEAEIEPGTYNLRAEAMGLRPSTGTVTITPQEPNS